MTAVSWRGTVGRAAHASTLPGAAGLNSHRMFRMNYSLTEEMTARGVDLLVLEGMGRAIHTNLYTRSYCSAPLPCPPTGSSVSALRLPC